MPSGQENIKTIEAALTLGFTVSEAVQRALGCPLAEFARRHAVRRVEVSMCLNAHEGRVYPEIRQHLADDLGVPREYIDGLIDRQRKERAEAESDAA